MTINPIWKHYAAAVTMTLLAVGGIVTWAAPSKTPAIVRTIVGKGDRICMILEGEDREACAAVALVAASLAHAAPSASVTGAGGAP